MPIVMLNDLYWVDSTTSICLKGSKSLFISHLKHVLSVLCGDVVTNDTALLNYTGDIMDNVNVSYVITEFGAKFLHICADGTSVLALIDDRLINGITNLIKELESEQ